MVILVLVLNNLEVMIMNLHSEFESQVKELIRNTILEIQNKVAKQWMSISEAAKYAGVSYNTFMKFRSMGLQICEIDGIKRVSKDEIDTFLKTNSF